MSRTLSPTWRSIGTLTWRGLLKLRANPQRLFDVVALPVVSTALFAGVFGGAIAGSVADYLPILIPGVMVQLTITASVQTGVQLCDDSAKGVFDRFRSLPIARVAPLAGALTADVIRYVVATAMTLLVGVVMGYRPASIPGTLAACVLVVFCAFALSWIFAYLGVVMSSPAAVQGVSMLALTPLSFMSNTLVPLDTMPGWIQVIAGVNPVSHVVTGVRELANHGNLGLEVLWAVLIICAVLAVMMPLTVRAYVRKS